MYDNKSKIIVKLDKWASPIIVEAKSAIDAKRIALEAFPTCDCCGQPTNVEYVNYLDTMITI